MQQNTVQTLIDYVKEDLTGQTNASTAKVIRALNFGVDHLSVLKLMTGSKTNPDSSNHTDITRTSVTTSASRLSLTGGDLDTGEAFTFRHLEVLFGSEYRRLSPIDSRDSLYENLQNQTGAPQYFDIEGEELRILPTPDGSYTYRLSYGRVHPRYSADNLTQATGLMPNEEEYVALYAADKIMIGTKNNARTAVRNELTVKAEEIKKMVGLRDQSSSQRLKPKSSTITRNIFKTR